MDAFPIFLCNGKTNTEPENTDTILSFHVNNTSTALTEMAPSLFPGGIEIIGSDL